MTDTATPELPAMVRRWAEVNMVDFTVHDNIVWKFVGNFKDIFSGLYHCFCLDPHPVMIPAEMEVSGVRPEFRKWVLGVQRWIPVILDAHTIPLEDGRRETYYLGQCPGCRAVYWGMR